MLVIGNTDITHATRKIFKWLALTRQVSTTYGRKEWLYDRKGLFQGHSLAQTIAFVFIAMLLFTAVLACIDRNIMIIGEITSAFFTPFFHLIFGFCRMLCKIIFTTTMFRHD